MARLLLTSNKKVNVGAGTLAVPCNDIKTHNKGTFNTSLKKFLRADLRVSSVIPAVSG